MMSCIGCRFLTIAAARGCRSLNGGASRSPPQPKSRPRSQAYIEWRNATLMPFVWTARANHILAKARKAGQALAT